VSRILMTLWDGGGNSPPVLSVAGALVERGHDVRVQADRSLAEAVAASGAVHVPWDTAPQRADGDPSSEFIRDYEPRTPLGALARIRDRLIIGAADRFAADTAAELAREPADVVAYENLLLGSAIAAGASESATASIVPNPYPGNVEGVPPFGLGLAPRDGAFGRARDAAAGAMGSRLWDAKLGEFNRVRAAFGLDPLATLFDAFAEADRVLVLTSAAFEHGGGAKAPANVRYCGPRLEDPAWAGAWEEPEGAGPLVLVSLSTTVQGQGPMIPRVAEALGRLPVRGLITTGPSYDGTALHAPPNVTVVPSAPHSLVLQGAAASVSHGGHGTVIKSLAAGVPVVCMPVGRDQPDVASRLVATGAGVRIGPGSRSGKIERALRTVLDDPSYASNAARMASAIAADRERDRAADELEALIG
jgi:MGT family glycosyltransferase